MLFLYTICIHNTYPYYQIATKNTFSMGSKLLYPMCEGYKNKLISNIFKKSSYRVYHTRAHSTVASVLVMLQPSALKVIVVLTLIVTEI